MSDERFESSADLGDAEGHMIVPASARERELDDADGAEGHLFVPASARERELDDADGAEGHAVNHRPLDKGRAD
jgi:hypothetical protein